MNHAGNLIKICILIHGDIVNEPVDAALENNDELGIGGLEKCPHRRDIRKPGMGCMEDLHILITSHSLDEEQGGLETGSLQSTWSKVLLISRIIRLRCSLIFPEGYVVSRFHKDVIIQKTGELGDSNYLLIDINRFQGL